jgi:hypothetical protein
MADPANRVTEENQNNPASQQNVTRELAREFKWVEAFQIGTNLLIAAVGLAALWIYYGQLKAMRGQLGEIIKQFPEIQKSANAAKSAADTAFATLQSSQEQFRNEQRPYIFASPQAAGPQSTVIQTLPDGRFQVAITVEINNGGRSPAIDTFSTPSRMYLGPRKEMSKKFKAFVPEYPMKTGDILASNVSRIVVTGELLTLSAQEMKSVNNYELAVYVMGAVKYTDVFSPHLDAPYETKYCFVFNPLGLPLGGCGGTIK